MYRVSRVYYRVKKENNKVKEEPKGEKMVKVIDIYGFEWAFATTEEAIDFIETFSNQEDFEIRRQTEGLFFYSLFEHAFAPARANYPERTYVRSGRQGFVN